MVRAAAPCVAPRMDCNPVPRWLSYLARVTDIVDGHLEVHYFGTSGQALSSAKFRPVYIDDGDQRPLLRSNGFDR